MFGKIKKIKQNFFKFVIENQIKTLWAERYFYPFSWTFSLRPGRKRYDSDCRNAYSRTIAVHKKCDFMYGVIFS